MNYNFDYEITYEKDVYNENSDDTNYRNDIIHVFNLTEHFDSEKIDDKAFFKFSCHLFQCGAFFSRAKTPILRCGLSATCLAIFSEKPDDLACL